METERLNGTVAAIFGILASMPETANIEALRAIRFADAALGESASPEALRVVKGLIDGIVAKAKSGPS